ncbi:toll/interleukin-1 receptor domain-containing protein [Chitinophaga filiformis]|uniref:Toll/interleukin-1 receptor domain-containing protein n=1 Tax=Chitinophaga filiformis TaxID=104663 RepID=A0ABY4I3J8_CHIFI|nr:toll/interleukin-1 receptor domain-containing protein [Chitinophaga filiformis]UPK70427.1 toll/interleukin-1 receptor domain-containing protein [Chitinophaga filiformis]
MNLIVFLIRAFTGAFFLLLAAISMDPTLSKNNPEWHASYAAAFASLLLAAMYFWSLFVEAKRRKVVARWPTARSFTVRRLFTFGRWWLAYTLGMAAGAFFLELKFTCGILLLIVVAWLMPPLDWLLFAPGPEMAVRLKGKGNAAILRAFSNLGGGAAVIAIGYYAQKNEVVAIGMLLTSIGLLLSAPVVLFVKGGWKGLSLKPVLLPAATPYLPVETSAGRPIPVSEGRVQRGPSPKRQTRRKYYSAKAWYWNWPIPPGGQRYPLDEQNFNFLIRGFEESWLESKEYYQRLGYHRDPPAFIREIIAEVETYIQSMELRPELLIHNNSMSLRRGIAGFIPHEVGKIWQEDRRLRSLYQATRWFVDNQAKLSIMPFRAIAPHIAEYRAMINLVKHLRHSLSRMRGQEVKKLSDPINKPMQTEEKIPIVFISYSWDTPEHENWVIRLATRLRENGVDAILDKWDLGLLGNLLPHFMETSISKSDRVICVMTPNYKKKTENLAGGVGYEYSIITAEIFADSINTSKFIPLIRRGTDIDAIPVALRGRKYVDMRNDAEFDEKFIHELLRDIHNEPKYRKPPIGSRTNFN